MWRLNNMLLNIQWFTEETKEEIKKKIYRENDNEIMMVQTLWDTAKVVLKELRPQET